MLGAPFNSRTLSTVVRVDAGYDHDIALAVQLRRLSHVLCTPSCPGLLVDVHVIGGNELRNDRVVGNVTMMPLAQDFYRRVESRGPYRINDDGLSAACYSSHPSPDRFGALGPATWTGRSISSARGR